MARFLFTWSEVGKSDETKVLYAVPTVAVESVDPGNIFTVRNLLLFPFLSYVTRPVNDFVLVLVCNLQTVNAILTRPNSKSLSPLVWIDSQSDGALLLTCGLEDGWLLAVREGSSNTSHEVVLRVIPNLKLSQFDHLLLKHFLHLGFSWPLEVNLTTLMSARKNG